MKRINITIALFAIALMCTAQSKTIFGKGFLKSTEGVAGSYSFGWGSNFKITENLAYTAGLMINMATVSNYAWTDKNDNEFIWEDAFLANFPMILSLQYNYPLLKMENHKKLGLFIEPMLLYQPIAFANPSISVGSYPIDGIGTSVYNIVNWELGFGLAYKYKRKKEIQLSFYLSNLDMFKAHRNLSINGEKFAAYLPADGVMSGVKLIFAGDPF